MWLSPRIYKMKNWLFWRVLCKVSSTLIFSSHIAWFNVSCSSNDVSDSGFHIQFAVVFPEVTSNLRPYHCRWILRKERTYSLLPMLFYHQCIDTGNKHGCLLQLSECCCADIGWYTFSSDSLILMCHISPGKAINFTCETLGRILSTNKVYVVFWSMTCMLIVSWISVNFWSRVDASS